MRGHYKMSLPKIEEIENLKLGEIQIEILKLKKELFELRIKKGTRQSLKPHLFKHIQHRLNQLIFLEAKKLFEDQT